jgi:hypothetical protein
VQLAMFALCVAAVGSFLWLRSRARSAEGAPPPSPTPSFRLDRIQQWTRRYRWEAIALCLFAAYLVFPSTLSGATLVYQRWFPPAFAIFVVVAAPRDLWPHEARIARVVAAVLPMATLLITWPSFADSSRSHQQVEELMPLVAEGSSIVELELGPGDPSRWFSMAPSGARILAERGGRLAYAFTDSPISPVIVPKEYQWNEAVVRLGFDCWAFRPAHDFKSFRYALVRTSDANTALLAQIVLAPEGRLVTTVGEWALFESTLPVIPPLSPEEPMPDPPPPQLRERAARLVAKEGGLPAVVVPSSPDGQQF